MPEPPQTEPSPTEPSPTEPSPAEPSPAEPSPTEPSPTEPSPPPAPDILVVDDDDTFRGRLGRALAARGAAVHLAADHPAALALLPELPALAGAVIDLRMPGPSGLEVVAAVAAAAPAARIVVLTGYASLSTAMEAGRLGAAEYLTKPAHADAIWAALRGATDPAPPEPPVPTPSLAGLEWLHIQQVLDDCDGNRSEAARRLGLHRRTLQRKLQKFPPEL